MVHWNNDATQALISIWGNSRIQEGFDGTKRNGQIYAKIKSKLDELGFQFDLTQVVNKCKCLKKKYMEERDEQNRSGHGPSEWAYFGEMDEIFGNRPATNPTFVAGSSIASCRPPSTSSECSSMAGDRPRPSASSSGHDGPSTSGLNDSGLGELAVPQEECPQIDEPGPSAAAVPNKLKRKVESASKPGRKKNKSNLVEELSTAFEKSTNAFYDKYLEEQTKRDAQRIALEQEREDREDQRVMRMSQAQAERNMQLVQMLGTMWFRPQTPQNPAMPYPPTSIPAYPPTSTPAYHPTSTPAYPPTSTPAYHPTSTPAYHPTSTSAYSPLSTPSYPPTSTPVYSRASTPAFYPDSSRQPSTPVYQTLVSQVARTSPSKYQQ